MVNDGDFVTSKNQIYGFRAVKYFENVRHISAQTMQTCLVRNFLNRTAGEVNLLQISNLHLL